MALTRIGLNQSINLASNVTGTLPTGNGGTGATSFAPGKVLQVVQGSTVTEVAQTTTSYADTGLSAAITPSSSSNKILVQVVQSYELQDSSGSAPAAGIKILRDSTTIFGGDRTYEIFFESYGTDRIFNFKPLVYLDTPSTTSAITYKTQAAIYQSGDRIGTQPSTVESIITLMEISS